MGGDSRKEWKGERIGGGDVGEGVSFRYRRYRLLYKVKWYEMLGRVVI